jgi:hypothetical protein
MDDSEDDVGTSVGGLIDAAGYLAFEAQQVFAQYFTSLRVYALSVDGDEARKILQTLDRLAVSFTEKMTDIQNKTARASGEFEHAASVMVEKYEGMSQGLAAAKAEIAALRERLHHRLKEHNPASPEVRKKVLELTGGRCAYCDAVLEGVPFEVEHVVPRVNGGPDHISNYVPSCSACNAKKSTGHVIQFIKRNRIVSEVA